jgi:AraC-like DNA-binding protein
MPRKKPFIASHYLEQMTPEGIAFHIKELTYSSARHFPSLAAAHRHNYYLLAISTGGTSSHMIDFEKISVSQGQIMLVVPGQVHRPLPSIGATGWGIAFTADFLPGTPQLTLPSYAWGPVCIPDEDFKKILSLTGLMHQEFEERGSFCMPMLQHYLSLILLLLKKHSQDILPPGNDLVTRYRELLATHYLEWTKPAQYAEALHISVDYLNEVVRERTGQTASSLISDRRILEAKRLLLHANENIKEIAWHLQFNEVSYFNRFFKQHTGYTPAAFREFVRDKS